MKVYPILALNGLDNLKLSFDFKLPDTTNNFGVGIAPIIASTHTGVGMFINKGTNGRESTIHIDKNNSETYWGNIQTVSNFNTSQYYTIELSVENDTATFKLYNSDSTLLRTYSHTLSSVTTDYNTLANRDYGITVGWNNNSNVKMYIKNIKAEPL